MRKYLFTICCMLSITAVHAQNTINIASGTTVVNSATVTVNANNFVNNGAYTDNAGAFLALGGVTFSGSGTTTLFDFTVNNTALNTLSSLVSVQNTATLTSGTLTAGVNNLYIRTDLYPLTANLVVTGSLEGTVDGLITNASVTNGACPVSSTLSTNVSGDAVRYQWQSSSNNSTWGDISGATNATFVATVTATAYYRCNLTTNNSDYSEGTPGVLITTTGGPSISAGSDVAICNGSSTTLNATGGSTYSWAPSTGLLVTTGASVSANPTSPVTYTVTGTDGSGCSNTATVTVTVNNLPAAVTANGAGTFCGSTTITAVGGTGGTVYFQGTTSGGTSTVTASASELITTSGTHTYYFRSQSAAGCWGTEGSVTVTINDIPDAVTANGAGAFCGSTTITASGGTGGTIYFQGTTSGGTSTVTASASELITTSGTHTYYFRSQSAAGCWGDEGSVTVTINDIPAAVTVSGSGPFCTSTTITASGGLGGTIYFQGTTSGGTSTLTASASRSVTATGIYYFRSRSAAGCWGAEGSATVTANPLPAVHTFTGGGGYCIGDPGVHIGLTLTDNGVRYELFMGATSVSSVIDGTTGTPIDFGIYNTTGVYHAIATDTLTHCTSFLSGVTVSTNPLPDTFTVNGSDSFCANGTGVNVFLTNSVSGIDYQLWHAGSAIGSAAHGNGAPIDFGPQTSGGYYTVIATNPGTGCMNLMADSALVTVQPLPVHHNVTGGGISCRTLTGIIVGIDTSEIGVNYQVDGGTARAGNGDSLHLATELLAGTYYVTAVNAITGCSDTMGSAVISFHAQVANHTVTVSRGGNFCVGDTGVHIGLNGSTAGVKYQLYRGSTAVGSPKLGTGALDFGLFTTAGTYTVMATDTTTGCTRGMTDSAVVKSNPVIATSLSLSTTPGFGNAVCLGVQDTFTAKPTNGGTAPVYSWKINNIIVGATDSVFRYIPVNGDVVKVRITSNAICAIPNIDSATMTVNVDTMAVPSVFIDASPRTSIAIGEPDTLRAIVTNGGPSPSYQWYKNGAIIPGASTSVYISNTLANHDSISCKVVTSGGCGGVVTYNSVVITVFHLGVTQVASTTDIRLVPNPNRGQFIVKGTISIQADEEVSFEITNMLGQVIYTNKVMVQNGAINEQVRLSNTLPNGMYILNLRSLNSNNVFRFVMEQ